MNRIAASLVVLTVCASGAWAADQPKADVRVTNTAAEPVPVAVTAVPADPLPFARGLPGELFVGSGRAVISIDGVGFGSGRIVQVPEGKTLVLEAGSGDLHAIGCAPVISLLLQINPCETCPAEVVARQTLRFTPAGQNGGAGGGEIVFVANDALHLYAPPGSSVFVTASAPTLACTQRDAVANVTVLGHYVPAR